MRADAVSAYVLRPGTTTNRAPAPLSRVGSQQAVRWKYYSGTREAHAVSSDLSSSGIFLLLDEALKDGTNVELEMTLPSEITLTQSVRRHCLGHVQRSEYNGVAAAIDKYEFYRTNQP